MIVKGSSTFKRTNKDVVQLKEYSAILKPQLPSLDGHLIVGSKIFEKQAFCVETEWDADLVPEEWAGNNDDEEAIAITCDECADQAFCTYLKDYYQRNVAESRNRDRQAFLGRLIGDFQNFEEFRERVNTLIEEIWKVVDVDENGLLNEILEKEQVQINHEIFTRIVNFVHERLDFNWDEEISVHDAKQLLPTHEVPDGIRSKLVFLPAPVFDFYSALDTDRNDKVSLEEFELFFEKMFSIIDQDDNNLLELHEFMKLLEDSQLPLELQAACELILQGWFTRGNYLLNRFFAAADYNKDKVTTIQEVKNFKEFDFIETFLPYISTVITPDKNDFQIFIQTESYEEALFETLAYIVSLYKQRM